MSQPTVVFRDWETKAYGVAWELQEERLQQLIHTCEEDRGSLAGYLFLVEHPHVFTLGNSGNKSNLLVNEDFLTSKGAAFYKINRGGDITYHGPGQIVGYPVLRLADFGIGIREYVFRLEEVVIRVLHHYGIEASRLEGATGVWLDAEITRRSRKICAIGVRVSRGVTMHGFAFNINTDLSYYQMINPCGFTDRGVTSIARELGYEVDFFEVKKLLTEVFASVFDCQIRAD